MVVQQNGKFGFYDGKISGKINAINGTITDKANGYDVVTSNEEEYEVSVLRKTFIVTFDANGGTASFDNKAVIYNKPYGELPIAERTGYTFAGWSTSTETDNFITQLTIVEIEDNHTITAKWIPNSYNIAYNNNTGIGEIENTPCTYDTEVTIATPTEGTITKTGYTFKNWNTKPDATGTTYEPGEVVKNLTDINNETITLYAIWQDTIAPSKTAPTGVGTTNSITVNCNQTDDGTGIDTTTIEYAIYKDGAWSEWQSSNIFQELITNTEYQVKTRAIDNSGNGPIESEVGVISTTLIKNGTIVIHKENASGEEVELNTNKENNSKQINNNIHITATLSTVANTNTTVTVKNTDEEKIYPNTTVLPNEQGIIEIPIETKTDTYEIIVQTTDGTNTISDTYYVFIDKMLPTANPTIQATTNSLTILANAEDANSGVEAVTYELKQGETTLQLNSTGVFEGLQHNTDYDIVINVTDKAGNSNSIIRNAKTDELVVGDLEFKKNISQVEFLPATTNQEKVWLNEDLLITINQGSSGNTTYKVQKADETEFVEYAQDGLITVENGDYIITVVTTDGTNTVSKEYYFTVDKTAPEINTYIVASLDDVIDGTTIIESTEITQSKYIVTVAKDEASGIVAYALNNNSSEEPTYTEFDATAQILEKSNELTKNGLYYVYVKDQAGNIAVKEVNINNIGYVVQYNLNGGTSEPEIQNQVKLQGTNLTLTNIKPSKVGYIFKGWATSPDATEVEYNSNGVYMKDEAATLYAVWSEAVASATIGEEVTYYETVQDAINSTASNEATVTLIKSEIVESITIVAGQNIILNVNGSTLRNEDGKPTIDNYGTLTIEGDGLLTSDSSTCSTVVNNNRTFIQDAECVIENTGSGVDGVYALKNLSTAVLKAGSVVSTQGVAVGNSSTLTLGDSSDEVDSSTPVIIGKICGISEETTGVIVFFDGVVQGQSGEGSAINGAVGTVASGYELYKTIETVDDIVVESAKLVRVAVFDTGNNVNRKMKILSGTANASYNTSNSNIQAIKESATEPDISTMTSNNIVSLPTSAVPIYMWYEDGTIYWWSEAGRVKLNGCDNMFYNFRSLSDIVGLASWDTSGVKYMRQMFNYCSAVTDITPLTSWNTSSVLNMGGMFSDCSAVTDITPLTSWDTSSVTNMTSMFNSCSSLSDLTGITSWDTSSVINMSSMFYGCSSLSDLTGLTSWDTSSVKDMSSMFYNCSSISDLTGLESWETSSVTNMSSMFNRCSSISDLTGLTSWDTSSVKDMSSMFNRCSSISDLTGLTSWDTSSVKDMSSMFYNCSSISDLTGLESWETSSVTNMSYMYYGCSSLSDVTGIESWETSSVTNMSYMFYGCRALTNLTSLTSWETSSVTNMSYMFYGCSTLSNLTGLESWETSSVLNMGGMFNDCSAVTDITPLTSWDTSSVTNMSYMFCNCSALTDLTPLANWDTSSVTKMDYMFSNCSRLSNLAGLESWNTSSVTSMYRMFYYCSLIIDATGINNWNIANVTRFTQMFGSVRTHPDWNGTWDSNGTFTPGETTLSVASLETGEEVSTTENASATLMAFAIDEVEETTPATPIVQIGTTTYPTIAEAIATINSGETLTLLDNITLTEELVIPKNKSITLDLNSKTITSSLTNTISNQGTLTITSMGIIRNEVENGSVIYNTGTLNINNGVITTSTNGGKAVYNNVGVLNITSGKIVTEGISGIGIYNVNNSKVNMQGGIIEVTGTSNRCIYNDSVLEISGGKIIVSGDDSIGIYNLDKATKCTMKDVEILVEAETIENYELIKNTDEFKQELEQMKPSYGIYNNSTINVEIQTATITVERLKGVGMINKIAGSITLGIEDEEVNSASPVIYAISDNTTAIINSEEGQINFFDGRLSTLSSIKNVITKVLDNYEIVEEVGKSVINSILKLIETETAGTVEDIK